MADLQTSNTYERIPDITDADRLVDKFGDKVLLSELNFNWIAGGRVESCKLAPDPQGIVRLR